MQRALVRSLAIGSTAFLTLVDLFAAQAILPSLAAAYGVRPAAMGLAVNAATLGMALGALAMALFSARIDRRRGVMLSLAVLSIPTALLAVAPGLAGAALLGQLFDRVGWTACIAGVGASLAAAAWLAATLQTTEKDDERTAPVFASAR